MNYEATDKSRKKRIENIIRKDDWINNYWKEKEEGMEQVKQIINSSQDW